MNGKPHIWWDREAKEWCCATLMATLADGGGLFPHCPVSVGPTPGDAYYNWKDSQ